MLETPTLLNMTSSKVLRHLEETWDQTMNEKGIFFAPATFPCALKCPHNYGLIPILAAAYLFLADVKM